MGKLKPIGSEKLQGFDKIQRMIEISTYNLNKPSPINETTSNSYSKRLVDGNIYHIVKEKSGYVIKKGLNENIAEYIEPLKNRKFYSSYSQAFKRLNLIVKELNENFGYKKNISLFVESDDKKYYLELPEQDVTQQPTPAPAPAPAPVQTPDSTTTTPTPDTETMAEPEMPETNMDVETDVETPTSEDEEVVTYKTIQKSVGKLAQKTRQFLSDEDNDLDTKQIKYIVNSILSALPLENLDEEDKEQIMAKFEGSEETDEENMDYEETDSENTEMPTETPTQEIPQNSEMSSETEMKEMYPRHGRRESFEERQRRMFRKEEEYNLSESKVDKVLKKYFYSENKKINNVENLSESYNQEKISKNLIKKFPLAKLLGKNTKKQLVFEINNERFFITPKGNIL